jgi:DNA-binding PadR family transcriptional regulator
MRGDRIRGHLDALLLAALAEGAEHGYGVASWLRARSGRELDLPEGTIYPALHRLEKAGLASSRLQVSRGRRQRIYALTPRGHEALSEQRAEWARFSAVVGDILLGPSAEQKPPR